MHFWIDKRSQACGFGRARVAASLSGGGGLGFGHPRRVPRKSMVTPIHRFQTVDCSRPHFHRSQQQQQQQQQQTQQQQSSQSLAIPSTAATNHTSAANQQQQQHQNHPHHHQQQPHHQQQHPQQGSHPQQHFHHHPHHPHYGQSQAQQQQQQQQPHHSNTAQLPTNNQHQQQQVQLHSSGQYSSHSNILPAQTPYPQSSPNLQHSPSLNAHNYHVPVSMNHIYSAPIHPGGAEIDHSNNSLTGISSAGQPHIGHDAQLLPAHLKCGMWASLALATVFVAGAKFYFDHQGTGLEVLIFCAFSATFFLAACTVSLWRRPRDLQISGNNVISETISNAEQSSLQNNPELMSSNPSPLLNGSAGGAPIGGLATTGGLHQASLSSIVAPPPPYHIAILLPETTKEAEEMPPPSYDKIVI